MVLSLLLMLLAGCMKQPDAVRADRSEPVAVAGVLTSVDDGETATVAAETLSRLSEVVRSRNLEPKPVESAALAQSPSTTLRLELLAKTAGDATVIVLMEASARFFSQMNGQYRWTVDVRLTLAPSGQLVAEVHDDFEVPVFLQFDHEAEAEALIGALPVIERRLGALLDQHLRAQGDQEAATP